MAVLLQNYSVDPFFEFSILIQKENVQLFVYFLLLFSFHLPNSSADNISRLRMCVH